MSATILLIALGQAVVILVVALFTGNLTKTISATLVMSLFAIVTGNAAYAVIDLVAIWGVFFLLRGGLVAQMVAKTPQASAPARLAEPESEAWARWIYILSAGIVGAFFIFHSDPPAPAYPLPAAQAVTPKKETPAKPAAHLKSSGDPRRCLDLESDRAITACAEKYR